MCLCHWKFRIFLSNSNVRRYALSNFTLCKESLKEVLLPSCLISLEPIYVPVTVFTIWFTNTHTKPKAHDWITEKYVIVYMTEEEEEVCNRTPEILSQAGDCSKRMLGCCHFWTCCTSPKRRPECTHPHYFLLGGLQVDGLIANNGSAKVVLSALSSQSVSSRGSLTLVG